MKKHQNSTHNICLNVSFYKLFSVRPSFSERSSVSLRISAVKWNQWAASVLQNDRLKNWLLQSRAADALGHPTSTFPYTTGVCLAQLEHFEHFPWRAIACPALCVWHGQVARNISGQGLLYEVIPFVSLSVWWKILYITQWWGKGHHLIMGEVA